jgi:hypothetical protein
MGVGGQLRAPHIRKRGLEFEKEQKRALAQRIAAVLERRRKAAAADDFSRMAWLAIHLGQEAQAHEYAMAGLSLDSENYHCQKIVERLYI